jgi:hypothetical protein
MDIELKRMGPGSIFSVAALTAAFLGAEPRTEEAPPDSPARRILLVVAGAARANRPPERLEGDALTDRLVRAAFAAARSELDRGTQAGECVRGLLLALGAGLDSSALLENHPLARALSGRLETDAEKRSRIAAIAGATLGGRGDSLQHFVVSAALSALVGEPAAWAAGVEKETLDAMGKDRGKGSGFSFADLTADQAGLAFAALLKRRAEKAEGLAATLDRLARGFRGRDFLPDLAPYARDPLEELGWKAFEERFGSVGDPRFAERVRVLREAVARMPGLGIR